MCGTVSYWLPRGAVGPSLLHIILYYSSLVISTLEFLHICILKIYRKYTSTESVMNNTTTESVMNNTLQIPWTQNNSNNNSNNINITENVRFSNVRINRRIFTYTNNQNINILWKNYILKPTVLSAIITAPTATFAVIVFVSTVQTEHHTNMYLLTCNNNDNGGRG